MPALNPVGAGLSPRVRGNLLSSPQSSAKVGSIPACTGEPYMSNANGRFGGVYPRVYGGTVVTAAATPVVTGLSPRVRGNLEQLPPYEPVGGSIPVCTGEPAYPRHGPALAPVYPRVYGGTALRAEESASASGLSPRVRGNHRCRADHRLRVGSIPACTGEPLARTPGRRTRAVYPRVYGGTISPLKRFPAELGLSPRVRGNLWSGRGLTGRFRSIPACTGEPVLAAV